MITHASFRNFKALRSLDVRFQRLTVIVGPNGSGKTSVLQGLHEICQRATNQYGDLRLNSAQFAAIASRGAERPIEITVGWRGETARTFRWSLSRPDVNSQPYCIDDIGELVSREWRGVDRGELAKLMNARLLRLDPSRLRDPSYSMQLPPVLDTNGKGLASVVAYYKGKYTTTVFQQIEESLRSVIPIIREVRVDRVPIPITEARDRELEQKTIMADAILFDFVGAEDVPAESASEGTLLVLALLTQIMTTRRPLVLLMDNIDHGLHPKAQVELIRLLRALLASNPQLQIIGTAHSPYLLHAMNFDEILVTSLRDDGSAVCARLDDHPDIDRWKEAMTPGEFWSHVGEGWIDKQKTLKAAS